VEKQMCRKKHSYRKPVQVHQPGSSTFIKLCYVSKFTNWRWYYEIFAIFFLLY